MFNTGHSADETYYISLERTTVIQNKRIKAVTVHSFELALLYPVIETIDTFHISGAIFILVIFAALYFF